MASLMEDTDQEKQVRITVQGVKESKSSESVGDAIGIQHLSIPLLKQYKRWLLMALFSILVLFGQSAATLLGRLYYEKGGNSKWLSALRQVIGFPILLPFLYNTKIRKHSSGEQTKPPSAIVLGSIYMVLGILLAAVGMLFAVGLLYLPVSTFSLISASQLGFNALFSFFLNSQKFTPFIVNSLVLLTTSSALLMLQTDSSGSSKHSNGKYIVGFMCTLFAAAGYSLLLSLSQVAFNKILKKKTVKELLDFIIYESLVASCILSIGLFASGEWKTLTTETNKFELGKISYTMTLMWIAVCWQIFSIGIVGLVVKVSSLFANVISTLSLPVLILAVFIFKDRMSGVKAVAMLLAIWGFISYIYHHYLDDLESKSKRKDACNNDISGIQK